tara:strand:- start:17736 stop:18560 length:825 start_codon:yes stop_codon:yes gene_type:complete
MASEFEKALVAIDTMSYEEKMEFARELKENHQFMAGHDPGTCVFCTGTHNVEYICNWCYEMFDMDDWANQFKCFKCKTYVFVCSDCTANIPTHDKSECKGQLCYNCNIIGEDIIECKKCDFAYENPYKNDYHKEEHAFTLKEIMVLGKLLKENHTDNIQHRPQYCLFCKGCNTNKNEICDICFKIVSTYIDDDRRPYNNFLCFNCQEYAVYCEDCESDAWLTCEHCSMNGEYDYSYCFACLREMDPEVTCEKHNEIYIHCLIPMNKTKAIRSKK